MGNFNQPTDISGCIVWLQGDGVVNKNFGFNIGNNEDFVLPLTQNAYEPRGWYNQGNLPFPNTEIASYFKPIASDIQYPFNSGWTYKTNRLNTHATVMVSGGAYPLLADTTGEFLTNLSTFTAFHLFKIYNDVGGSVGTLLAQSYQYTSAFEDTNYFFGLQGGNSWNFYSKSSSPVITNLYQQSNIGYLNDWIIRTDIIDSGFVTFRRNGTTISSGNITNLTNNGYSASIYLGNVPPLGMTPTAVTVPYSGEFAEIILYDHTLSPTDITNVETYLKFKYFVAGAGGIPLNINGCNTGTSGIYNPLVTLYTNSYPASGNIPLYTGSAYTMASGVNLFTIADTLMNTSIPLYTGSSTIVSSGMTIYINGNLAASSGVFLYTNSSSVVSNNTTLFTISASSLNSNFPVYVYGLMVGSGVNFPLYLSGLQNKSTSNQTSLFIAVNTSANGSGLYKNTPFYLAGASTPGVLPLFIQTNQIGTNNVGMNLFVRGPHPSSGVSNSVPLYLQNNVQSTTPFPPPFASPMMKMFVKGLGGLDGGLTTSSNMNLYVKGT